MTENKTVATEADVATFLAAVEPESRRADALALDAVFRDVTGFAPRMWGPSIVGYGQYHYVYDSGREGHSLATGFAVRKNDLVLYIMPGYADFGDILDRLGKHRKGKSCLYFKRIEAIDEGALRELIAAGLDDLGKKWPVEPT